MAANNVLFAILLALIAGVIACVPLRSLLVFWRQQLILAFLKEDLIAISPRLYNLLVQDEGSTNDFGFFQREQEARGTTYSQAWPLCSI